MNGNVRKGGGVVHKQKDNYLCLGVEKKKYEGVQGRVGDH